MLAPSLAAAKASGKKGAANRSMIGQQLQSIVNKHTEQLICGLINAVHKFDCLQGNISLLITEMLFYDYNNFKHKL